MFDLGWFCQETDREDSGREVSAVFGALVRGACLSLLLGILFQLSPLRWPIVLCHRGAVPTLTVHERVMRDVALWEHALCKSYLSVI